jgi:CheY-like chemotaxis protein
MSDPVTSPPPFQSALPSVLIIDDDEFSRAMLRKVLTSLGVSDIHDAVNGLDGLRVLNRLETPPDFMICDVFMPDMDGIEFVGALVKLQYEGGLLLVTGGNIGMLEVANEIAQIQGLNVLGTFTKPVLAQALGRAMGLPNA